MLRLLSIGLLALLLQVPVLMIGALVNERSERRDEAQAEVSSKWGGAQSVTGPALVVPYNHQWTEVLPGGQPVTRRETRTATFLPERLHVEGTLDSDVRRRGIFSVPVYRLDLVMDGEFARPAMSDLGIDPSTVEWDRAYLAVGISDPRAIQAETAVSWDRKEAAFLPGTLGFLNSSAGIHAPVLIPEGVERIPFSFPLALNGSLRLDLVPFGGNTAVELEADHGSPSFQGNWLPVERKVDDGHFSASWSIPFLGRSYPQSWSSDQPVLEAVHQSRFGVALVDPVDHYRMADRSVKYASLFILLTFATVWLFEILAGLRVHPIQYLLLGSALCLFYLLELSLGEHLGFPVAYALASAAVVGMVGAYAIAALRSVARAATVGGCVALLYGYLYLLLQNEDYALLLGSVSLFAILGAIMYLTRRVDWYKAGTGAVPAEGQGRA
jgi:inner membrane protein